MKKEQNIKIINDQRQNEILTGPFLSSGGRKNSMMAERRLTTNIKGVIILARGA